MPDEDCLIEKDRKKEINQLQHHRFCWEILCCLATIHSYLKLRVWLNSHQCAVWSFVKIISAAVSVQSADTTLVIVCASYLFVFMSNSLDKTNTVTTQKKKKIMSKAVLAALYVQVTFFFLKKKSEYHLSINFQSLK